MRILSIHATRMWYHATQKTKLAEPADIREDQMEECVVLFCCVEKLDEKNPGRVIESALAGVRKRLGMLHVNRVLIYPYAHLTSTLGSPPVALKILRGLESALTKAGFDVKRAPFGWYKEFEIRGKGHPLADLSMTICPYEGSECDFTCPYCHHPFREGDAEHACPGPDTCSDHAVTPGESP
ncbi:threonyl-tRNA synthetase editing domain-containing protein [uncultured Methanoregula sp.]|uniref:threonyl-tRNA synthetase editing domain-containing protein n=1 Tax=uncultured Methanoregula sp. TaxID=1005933 RepID=UPI002AAB1232|nr:threonyl-tRNA synthetase editing domain-containing protein [uncultured Methanoregula sp.]